MKVITPGHRYQLDNFEDKHKLGQFLQFIEKRVDSAGSANLVTVMDGTTNEEVIKVLIDRLEFLNAKFPCEENSRALTLLAGALMALEKRTADRLARGVEGKHVA